MRCWAIFFSTFILGCTHVQLPRPKSDVPLITDIGMWPYQDALKIEQLDVVVVKAPLNLFNNEALVRFHLQGSISCTSGYRPFIKKLQISERLLTDPNGNRFADIQLAPIVAHKDDKKSTGQPAPFDLKVEKIIHSYAWGRCRYVVHAQNLSRNFDLVQVK